MINLTINGNMVTVNDTQQGFPIDADSATYSGGNLQFTYDGGSEYQVIRFKNSPKFAFHFTIGQDTINGSVVDADTFRQNMQELINSGGGCDPVELNKTITNNGNYTYSDAVYSPVNIKVDVQGGGGGDNAVSTVDWNKGLNKFEKEQYTEITDNYDWHIVPILTNFGVDEETGWYSAEFTGNPYLKGFEEPSIMQGIEGLLFNGEWVNFYDYATNFYDGSTGLYVFPAGTKIRFGWCSLYGIRLSNGDEEWGDKCETYQQINIDGEEYWVSISDFGKVVTKISDSTVYGYINGELVNIPDKTKVYLPANLENVSRIIISERNGAEFEILANNCHLYTLTDGADYLFPSRGRGTVGFIYDTVKLVNGGKNGIVMLEIELVGGKYNLREEYGMFGGDNDLQFYGAPYSALGEGRNLLPAMEMHYTEGNGANFYLADCEIEIRNHGYLLEFNICGNVYWYLFDRQEWEGGNVPPAESEYWTSWSIDNEKKDFIFNNTQWNLNVNAYGFYVKI